MTMSLHLTAMIAITESSAPQKIGSLQRMKNLSLVFVLNPITKKTINEFVAIALFALFFIFASTWIWSKKEIRIILNIVIIAGVICSVVLLYSGMNTPNQSDKVLFLSYKMNRNTAAFGLVPSILCATFMLLFNKKNSILKSFLVLAIILLCFYLIVLLGCRSAFLSVIAGMFLIVLQRALDKPNNKARNLNVLIIVIAFLLILLVVFTIVKGTNSERLFDFSDDTGRKALRLKAMALINEKPIFGGGFDYWSSSGEELGSHNTFMTIMLWSGYVGGGILLAFLVSVLYECVRAKNLIPLAFATELICHSITESGLDYYAYIPMILAFILFRYIENTNLPLKSLFE